MCGRYTLTSGLVILQRRFGFAAEQLNLEPRYNLAPSQQAPVIVMAGSYSVKMMRWGLVPSWAKVASIGYKMINARAETVGEKPSFKRPLQRTRCLVLADGFFEWRKVPGEKTELPLRFVLKSHEPFAFAGLWDTWIKPEGDELQTFTIITTEANELVQPVHNRMPVILPQEHEDVWLDPDNRDLQKLTALLKPYPTEKMEAYPVSTLVNSPKNDSPECIEVSSSWFSAQVVQSAQQSARTAQRLLAAIPDNASRHTLASLPIR